MPATYRVRYSRQAYDDLKQIFDYIDGNSPQNAPLMIERILEGIDSLEFLPHRYGTARDGGALDQTVRSMPVIPFLIRYSIDDPMLLVTIHSVRHGARGLEAF